MDKMKLMKLIVNNGHVIINIHDVMVLGLVIMVLMKLIAIDSQNVILTNMNVYRSQLSMSCVYQSIVLQMEMLIVWEELMKENTVAVKAQSST
jgi:hypothetical protein